MKKMMEEKNKKSKKWRDWHQRNIQYKLVCDFFQEFKQTDVENNGIFLKNYFVWNDVT